MKKVLLAFATLLFVACGNKVAQPEVAEEERKKLIEDLDPFLKETY